MRIFLKKYWLLILGIVLFMVVLTAFLIIVSNEPQQGSFVYQIN